MSKLVQPSSGKFAVVSVRNGRELLVKESDTPEEAEEVLFRVMKNTSDVFGPRDHVMILYGANRQVILSRNKREFVSAVRNPDAFMRKMMLKIGMR